jgi:AcrR family transcriptional regulator
MSAGDRRERLVEAAIRVMTRDGVARATTRAIAAEAEMPLGVFHYAFRSKQELMARVTESIALQSQADIEVAMDASEGEDLLGIVRAVLFAYLDHVVSHPSEHLVTYELTLHALRDKELGEVARRQHEYYQQWNEQMLSSGAEQFDLEYDEQVPVMARFIFSLMDGLAFNYLARGDEAQARAVVDLAARTMVSMVKSIGGQDVPPGWPDPPRDG